MNKKILSVTALSLVLVGCQQQAKNAVDSMANKAEEVKNSAVEKAGNVKNTVEDKLKGEKNADAVTAATHENIKVKPEEAVAKFKEVHADAKIESISLDNDDNKGFYYEIQGSNGAEEFEVEIDPITGDVTRDEKEKDTDSDGFIDETLVAKVMELAKKAIEDAGRDKYYNTAWKLSVEDGLNVVEVELHGHDVPELNYSYNAQTGELIEKSQD